LSCGKQPLSNNGLKISSKMQDEKWMVQADLYVIIIFFEKIVPRNTPNIWGKILWKTLEKNVILLLATLVHCLINKCYEIPSNVFF